MQKLISFIDEHLKHKRLEEISTSIINAYKDEDDFTLKTYAGSLDIEINHGSRKKMFYSIIKQLHPDRLPALLKEYEEAKIASDITVLNKIKQLLEIKTTAAAVKTERFEYEYHETWTPEPEDSDEYFSDERGFIFAVKSVIYGNHDFHIEPADFGQIDGSLDVGYYGLDDINGIEYCRNVRVLNLSGNDIGNIYDLQYLTQLEELYAADNNIRDIESIEELDNLEIVDLSGNDIEDISPLLKMSGLKFVNIRNNPVNDKAVIEKLEVAGVIVFR